MPPKKSGKKKSPKGGLADVTLNDFANSSVPNNRLKKSTNNVVVVLKQEVEKSWDEKELEEFDGDLEKNVDGTFSYVRKNMKQLGRKTHFSNSSKNENGTDGVNYPIDMWFKLSEYIRPEDVGRFAAICRTSYEVTLTPRFWFLLYRRYYKFVPNVPTYLQPEFMVRKYGLRTNVIRALYFTYKPFVDRLKPAVRYEEQHPCIKSLIKCECCLLFNIEKRYYFKMRRKVVDSLCYDTTVNDLEIQDILRILDDITINPDNNCRALEVTCLRGNVIPPVLGLTLASAALVPSVDNQYRYHKLQLGFRSGIGSSQIYAVLEPVVKVRILDWWHPEFPHNHNMEKLPSQNLRSENKLSPLKNYYNF